MNSLHLIISGRVQGVGYRSWTVGQAKKLGLDGWVRNRTDGTVEAVFAGETMQVDAMIAHCRKGPFAARVDDIQISGFSEIPNAGFIQKPTL